MGPETSRDRPRGGKNHPKLGRQRQCETEPHRIAQFRRTIQVCPTGVQEIEGLALLTPDSLYLEDDEAWPDATEWRKAAAVALGDDPGLDDFVSVDDLGQRFQTGNEFR